MSFYKRTFDIKKEAILKEICALAENTSIIKRVMVFENNISDKKLENSDLNICVEIVGNTRDLRLHDFRVQVNKICDYACDILVLNLIGAKLKKEIEEKGSIVYKK